MNLDQYQTEALRTESPVDSDLVVRYSDAAKALRVVLHNIMMELENLDGFKKFIFYNKPLSESLAGMVEATPDLTFDEINTGVDNGLIRMLHGVIGVLTECGETLEQLLPALANEDQVDWCNLEEEIGDKLWYLAIMADAANVRTIEKGDDPKPNLPYIAYVNIQKLRVRYPESFNQTEAQVRDLDAERDVLENN